MDDLTASYLVWDEYSRLEDMHRREKTVLEEIPDEDRYYTQHCYGRHPYYDPPPLYRRPTKSWREWSYVKGNGDVMDVCEIVHYEEAEDYGNEHNSDQYFDWEV